MDARDAALAALLTLVAFAVGLTLPDADLALGIGHRHALTHSVAPAALLLARPAWRAAACGTAGGLGLHLAADCFPNAMTGFALVKLPLAGAIGAGGSYLWLAANAAAALALATLLAWRIHAGAWRAAVLVAALAGGAWYLWRTDGGWPVLALAMLAGAAAAWRRHRTGATPR